MNTIIKIAALHDDLNSILFTWRLNPKYDFQEALSNFIKEQVDKSFLVDVISDERGLEITIKDKKELIGKALQVTPKSLFTFQINNGNKNSDKVKDFFNLLKKDNSEHLKQKMLQLFQDLKHRGITTKYEDRNYIFSYKDIDFASMNEHKHIKKKVHYIAGMKNLESLLDILKEYSNKIVFP